MEANAKSFGVIRLSTVTAYPFFLDIVEGPAYNQEQLPEW
jgi:hypothetical protein